MSVGKQGLYTSGQYPYYYRITEISTIADHALLSHVCKRRRRRQRALISSMYIKSYRTYGYKKRYSQLKRKSQTSLRTLVYGPLRTVT